MAATHQRLVDAARKLFARRGYRLTSCDEVCARAGVTKGAIYHHFKNKEDLFLAVLVDIEKDFVRAGTVASQPTGDVWDHLQASCQACLAMCARPDIRRVLIEAPAAVGLERTCQVEGRYLDVLRDGLATAAAEGIIDTRSPAILAQLLFGLFGEAANVIASAQDPTAARHDVGLELDAILGGLRTPREPAPTTG